MRKLRAVVLLLAPALCLAGGYDKGGEPPPPAPVGEIELPEMPGAELKIKWSDIKGVLEELFRARAVTEEEPPAEWAISSGSYAGSLSGGALALRADFSIEVWKKGWSDIVLVEGSPAVKEALIDGKPAPLRAEEGTLSLVLKGPGRFRLSAVFAGSVKEKPGPNTISIPIPRSAASSVLLRVPSSYSEVDLAQATLEGVQKGGAETVYKFVLDNSGRFDLSYIVPIPESEREELAAEKKKAEPKVVSEVLELFSIDEDVLRADAIVNYTVRLAPVSNFKATVSEGYEVVECGGTEVAGWKCEAGACDVRTSYEVEQAYGLRLKLEKGFGEKSAVVNVPEAAAQGVERESGFVAVQALSGAEVSVEAADGVLPLDATELPQQLVSMAERPILFAFKYVKPPFRIALRVEKHPEEPVLDAAVDAANVITQFTRDGKSVIQAVYKIRNNRRQFLSVRLPEGSKLWSAYVSERPVKPAAGKEGEILVPMEKSRRVEGILDAFPLEIIYLSEGSKISAAGRVKGVLPAIDLPLSEMLLTVFVPAGYEYLWKWGDLDEIVEEKPAVLPGLFLMAKRAAPAAGRDVGSLFEEQKQLETRFDKRVRREAPQKADLGQAMPQQLDMFQQQAPIQAFENMPQAQPPPPSPQAVEKGVLPTKFEIPRKGMAIRFSKLLVLSGEKPVASIGYVPAWFSRFLGLLLFAGMTAVVYKFFGYLWAARGRKDFLHNRRRLCAICGAAILLLVFMWIFQLSFWSIFLIALLAAAVFKLAAKVLFHTRKAVG